MVILEQLCWEGVGEVHLYNTRLVSTSNTRLVTTSLAHPFKLCTTECLKTNDKVKYMSNVLYASVVGCLIYALVCTRSNLAQVVSIVSKFLSNLV